MYIDFSSLFHRSSKDLRDKGNVYIPSDENAWPKEWSTTYYKSYPRFPKINLGRHKLKADYANVLTQRRSTRVFSKVPMSLPTLSRFLQYSCGILEPDVTHDASLRAYPSGGARFPIEIYPIVFAGSDDVPAGIYHYNVRGHSLDVLFRRAFDKSDISALFYYPWIQHASAALIMTAVFHRTQMKYGERGYRYLLLEAGHISENMYLTATALGIGCCAMGGMADERIEQLLDIDGITESVIHSVIVG